jgi:hypothetical protein
MCIMEVRAGQHSSTIAQAMAHNTDTVLGDITLFRKLLESRGEHERVVAVDRAEGNLKRAFADFLELFGEFCAEEEAQHGKHHSAHRAAGDDGTNERTHVHEDLGRIGHTDGDHRPDAAELAKVRKHAERTAAPYFTR